MFYMRLFKKFKEYKKIYISKILSFRQPFELTDESAVEYNDVATCFT